MAADFHFGERGGVDMNGAGGRRRRWRGGDAGDKPGGQGTPPEAPPTGSGSLPASGISEQKRLLIESALLIALIDESGHGYALIDRVQQIIGDQASADPGSVYRILRLLEEAGMITSSWELGGAGPQRRTYAVEPAGRALLDSRAALLAERGQALLGLSRLAKERLAQASADSHGER